MTMQQFDLIVVGTGPGGYVAAIRAAQLGLKTVVVEKAEVGGICLNWGCIPTKALLRSAELYSLMKRSGEFGLAASDVHYDFEAVVKRSRQVAGRLSKGVEFLLKKNNIMKVVGEAKLTAADGVQVRSPGGDTETLKASAIIVATGARSRLLPGLEIDGDKVITSREAMVLPKLPESIVIIGAGAIGAEFAYFFSTFGAKVTLIEMLPHILPLEDPELSDVVARSFKKQGIEVLTSAPVKGIEKTTESVTVTVETERASRQIEAELALVAVGVQGNTDNIGLEDLGVETEKSFVKVDDKFQTNVKGIYAIGDVIGPPLLAHVASAEGIAAVENIAGVASPSRVDYDNIPACTYCQPQVASLGLTEEKAKERGLEVRVGKFPFRANGRSLAMGDSEGFVKLVFDAKNSQLLGAHIVGAEATEILAELGVAKALSTKGHDIFRTIHAHPTISEAVMEAAAAAWGEAIHI